jgi:hypothetical protein
MLTLEIEETDPTIDREGPHGHWIARAHIRVDEFVRDEHGSIFLGSECLSSRELVAIADRLIQELEAIKRQAVSVKWSGRTH